jgi:hypothetical protein
MFRLETRAGEFMAMASLKVKSLNAQGNQQAHNQSLAGEARRLKGRGVMALMTRNRAI